MIEPKQLHELFKYNPKTGNLIWLVPGARRRKVGDIAGCKSTDGRILVGIKGKIYKAHRIIWAMMTGEWPSESIDHINENPSDNRWSNLRLATKSQNMMNISKIKSNTSGYKGVGWSKSSQKWRAYIKVDKISYHLGLFDTKEKAAEAYADAANKLHGIFARHQ
jgi:HNH endonuclease/AP2 domain